MSKKITVDPNLFNLSGAKGPRKSKKKYGGEKGKGRAHDVNYDKILKKLKEMKKNKLQTKKKKREQAKQTNHTESLETTVAIADSVIPIVETNTNLAGFHTQKPCSVDIGTTVPDNSVVSVSDSPNTPVVEQVSTPVTIDTNPIKNVITTPNPDTPSIPSVSPPLLETIPSTSLPAVLPILPDPKYGILKNGQKPTVRSLSTKQKLNPRFEKLRTIKRKYKLGKNGGKISVLLKNNKTRKKIKNEIQELKQKSIKEVRQYLQEKNIIKTGSIAPNNVLRKMYEEMYLAGNIENKNSENLIHNFVNDE